MLGKYREKLAFSGSVIISVLASTGKVKTEAVENMANGVIKINVKAIPEKGKANDALCLYLADTFQVPMSHVKLLSGQTNRRKKFKITL